MGSVPSDQDTIKKTLSRKLYDADISTDIINSNIPTGYSSLFARQLIAGESTSGACICGTIYSDNSFQPVLTLIDDENKLFYLILQLNQPGNLSDLQKYTYGHVVTGKRIAILNPQLSGSNSKGRRVPTIKSSLDQIVWMPFSWDIYMCEREAQNQLNNSQPRQAAHYFAQAICMRNQQYSVSICILQAAYCKYKLDQTGQSLQLSLAAIAIDPGNPLAYYYAALAYDKLGKNSSAYWCCKLAMRWCRLPEFEQMAGSFSSSSIKAAAYPNGRFCKGMIIDMIPHIAEHPINQYREVIGEEKQAQICEEAEQLLADGDYSSASDLFEQALSNETYLASLLTMKSQCCMQQGNLKEACIDALAACTLLFTYIPAQERYAQTLLALGLKTDSANRAIIGLQYDQNNEQFQTVYRRATGTLIPGSPGSTGRLYNANQDPTTRKIVALTLRPFLKGDSTGKSDSSMGSQWSNQTQDVSEIASRLKTQSINNQDSERSEILDNQPEKTG